jgi:hypothetical protein
MKISTDYAVTFFVKTACNMQDLHKVTAIATAFKFHGVKVLILEIM